jgi:RNA polymerase sigma-70 factor (ECF subfamily)
VPLDAREAEARCGAELAEALPPDQAYERRWAITLLERVLESLRDQYLQAGKARLFETMEDFLWGPDASVSYAQVAPALAMTEGAVRVAVHRLREQYREGLRLEVANTVGNPAEVDEELRYLIGLMC